MTDVLKLIQSVVPDAGQELITRINILKYLSQQSDRQGRKQIATDLKMTERAARVALDDMRGLGLVDINYSGVKITHFGLATLKRCQKELLGGKPTRLFQLEHDLRQKLGCQRCWVIEGDSARDSSVYTYLSYQVQDILSSFLPTGQSTVAVTGGSTLARIADDFTSDKLDGSGITFIPTRGGVRGNIEIQSNSVVAKMAQKTNGDYLPFYIPENLNEATKEALLKDQSIQKTVDLTKNADCLIVSIGTADEMASRRQVTKDQDELIEHENAVGEAFGTFFDLEGKTIISYPRIGLELKDLEKMPMTMTVVGGSHKAEAVVGFFKIAPSRNNWLVCDEGVAVKVLTGDTH